MRTWHPASYSEQAREMSNNWIEAVNEGYLLIDEVLYKVRVSYRQPLVKERAYRRFLRYVRAGKVKENFELYQQHYPNSEWKEIRERMARSNWGGDFVGGTN